MELQNDVTGLTKTCDYNSKPAFVVPPESSAEKFFTRVDCNDKSGFDFFDFAATTKRIAAIANHRPRPRLGHPMSSSYRRFMTSNLGSVISSIA